jgi:hypothetical protein
MNVINDPIGVHFTPTREDEAGTVRLVASSLKQKVRLFDHFKIFDMSDPTQMIAMAEALQSPEPYTHELTSPPSTAPGVHSNNPNKGWFLTTATLDLEWSTPYFNLLKRRTGFEGRGILPDIDLAGADRWQNISHTHFTKRRWFEHGHFCMETVNSASDWNGKPAADLATRYAKRQALHDIAQTIPEPEYIQCGNGMFKHNPRYANGVERWQAGTYSEEIWWALCDWWLATHANEAQKACIAASEAIHQKNVRGKSDLHNNRNGYHLQYDWHYPALTWEEFQALTVFPIPGAKKNG